MIFFIFLPKRIQIIQQMNQIVRDNFSKIHFSALFIPLIVIISVILFLYGNNALNATSYVEIQKDTFYFLNGKLSQLPDLQYNFTQIGDALIFLSILSIFFLKTPKMWEALLTASLFSLIFAGSLKGIIDIPRPTEVLDNQLFTIIGKEHVGYSSVPSGHSMTTFATLFVLALAFTPKSLITRVLYILGTIVVGLILAFSRVGVGAHYPLDVILGSAIGCISALLGIIISRKYPIWNWIKSPKFYPIFIAIFSGCAFFIILRILERNAIVYYISLVSLTISLFLITKAYVTYLKK